MKCMLQANYKRNYSLSSLLKYKRSSLSPALTNDPAMHQIMPTKSL